MNKKNNHVEIYLAIKSDVIEVTDKIQQLGMEATIAMRVDLFDYAHTEPYQDKQINTLKQLKPLLVKYEDLIGQLEINAANYTKYLRSIRSE